MCYSGVLPKVHSRFQCEGWLQIGQGCLQRRRFALSMHAVFKLSHLLEVTVCCWSGNCLTASFKSKLSWQGDSFSLENGTPNVPSVCPNPKQDQLSMCLILVKRQKKQVWWAMTWWAMTSFPHIPILEHLHASLHAVLFTDSHYCQLSFDSSSLRPILFWNLPQQTSSSPLSFGWDQPPYLRNS